jgi:hypothetical protein
VSRIDSPLATGLCDQFNKGIILVAKNKESRAGPSLRLAPEWVPRRDEGTGKVVSMLAEIM